MAMPERRDHWWTVTPDADIAAIQNDVEQAIVQHGLPWLERHSDLGWLATHYRGLSLRAAARCYVLAGNLAAARESLLGWISELEAHHARERDRISVNEGLRAVESVRVWARAVGLDL